MEKSLFRVKTRGCGVFYVIATTFDYAAGEVTRELNTQDYGYYGDRVVTNVEFICRETFIQNGKRALKEKNYRKWRWRIDKIETTIGSDADTVLQEVYMTCCGPEDQWQELFGEKK